MNPERMNPERVSGELDVRALAEESARWITGGVEPPADPEPPPGQAEAVSEALRASPAEKDL